MCREVYMHTGTIIMDLETTATNNVVVIVQRIENSYEKWLFIMTCYVMPKILGEFLLVAVVGYL